MAMQLPGTGRHRFWGFSPSYDLRDPAGAPDVKDPAGARFAALLLCPGDSRHILHTVAHARAREGPGQDTGRWGTQELAIHVYEERPEELARHLLMLSIALDFEVPRRERAEMFLEVLGNICLRERTASYVAARARELLCLFARGEGRLAAFVDLDGLRMKDRDALEEAVSTWLEGVPFDAPRLRDERLRSYYKDRYDHRRNVLDWDFSMGLQEEAPVIHRLHFRQWRLTGLAFELRDAAYDTPNRSLASAAAGRQQGASVLKRGFWGDIVNSPYPAVGVDCDDDRFWRKRSDQHLKTACDVAYYNVVGWFHRLETGRPYTVKEEDMEDFGYGASVGTSGLMKGFLRSDQVGPRPAEQLIAVAEESAEGAVDEDKDAKLTKDDADAEKRAAAQQELTRRRLAALPRFTVVVHTARAIDLFGRARLARTFEHVHIGSHAAHLLCPALTAVLADSAAVVVETARFLVEVHRDAKRRFATAVTELGARAGLAPAREATQAGGAMDSFVRFGYDRSQEAARRSRALETHGEEEAPAAAVTTSAQDAEAEAPAMDGAGAAAEALASASLSAPQTADGAGAPGDCLLGGNQPGPKAPKADARNDAIGTPASKTCAVTGLPAKYRDPKTGLYYANKEAFKELRRRFCSAPATDVAAATTAVDAAGTPVADAGHEPEAAPQAHNADQHKGQGRAEDEAHTRARQPPLVTSSGGVYRRLNKVI